MTVAGAAAAAVTVRVPAAAAADLAATFPSLAYAPSLCRLLLTAAMMSASPSPAGDAESMGRREDARAVMAALMDSAAVGLYVAALTVEEEDS